MSAFGVGYLDILWEDTFAGRATLAIGFMLYSGFVNDDYGMTAF
jgi:hypothetical protein